MIRRTLNDVEKGLVEIVHSERNLNPRFHSDIISIEYKTHRNFTYCFIDNGYSLFVGAAKRNPTDEPNPVIGEMMSFREAISI